ncbi:MAG: mechanosensitive ion channel family protein [Luteibaculum sp.]
MDTILPNSESDLSKYLYALLALAVFIVLGQLVKRLISKALKKQGRFNLATGFSLQLLAWVFYIVGLAIAVNLLGYSKFFSGILAGAGVGAIIIGFAFKDIGENFLSGILLAFNRPFEIGNIIEIEGFKGRVRKLNLRNTHVRNIDGRDIFIPNATLIKSPLVNYTIDGMLRLDFMLGVAPESNLIEVRDLIVQWLSERDFVLKNPGPDVVVQELGVSTVDLQVLFWVDLLHSPKSGDAGTLGMSARSEAIVGIKELLDAHNIEMPATILEHKMYRDNSFRVSS